MLLGIAWYSWMFFAFALLTGVTTAALHTRDTIAYERELSANGCADTEGYPNLRCWPRSVFVSRVINRAKILTWLTGTFLALSIITAILSAR
jgi:hypothetical protein